MSGYQKIWRERQPDRAGGCGDGWGFLMVNKITTLISDGTKLEYPPTIPQMGDFYNLIKAEHSSISPGWRIDTSE